MSCAVSLNGSDWRVTSPSVALTRPLRRQQPSHMKASRCLPGLMNSQVERGGIAEDMKRRLEYVEPKLYWGGCLCLAKAE